MLLDLLRVASRPAPVRLLVAAAEVFGIEGNALRVALSRLVQAELVDTDGEGNYRLAAESRPLARLVDAWRRGDARTRRWDGGWLALWHPRGGPRGERRRSLTALARLGFREGLEGLWIRPDNLAAPRRELAADLAELGLARGAELFEARGFDAALTERFSSSLWPRAELRRGYKRALRALEKSAARLPSLSPERAMVESFRLGGAAIRVLATDPLLPDAILFGEPRRQLHRAMLRYDELGREVWTELLEIRLTQTPAALGGCCA